MVPEHLQRCNANACGRICHYALVPETLSASGTERLLYNLPLPVQEELKKLRQQKQRVEHAEHVTGHAQQNEPAAKHNYSASQTINC
jgi:hypothetical protein